MFTPAMAILTNKKKNNKSEGFILNQLLKEVTKLYNDNLKVNIISEISFTMTKKVIAMIKLGLNQLQR